MTTDPQPTEFKFTDKEGQKFCREVLKKNIPFTPHDYQLDGVTHALDGTDVLAITATGSGKSAYIYMLMIILQELAKNPSLNPSKRHFPKEPVIVVISPTLALEEDQVKTMTDFGLTARAVNSVTKDEAEKASRNVWNEVQKGVAVIFVSPEMLISKGFEGLLQRKAFKERIYGLIMDEVHLMTTWGGTFRPGFTQVGLMRARFPEDTVFIAMTATLRKKPMEAICRTLGLHEGKFHLIRRSNARKDVQFIVRTLHASTASTNFPQLDWLLREKGKVLVFCSSIRYGFNLAAYLWHLDPEAAAANRTIRLFNSLNEPSYNTETLEMLRGSNSSKVTIATDKLSVGVNVSDFETAVIIDPKDPDDLIQKGGRVGRNRSKVDNPRIIIYISAALMTQAQELVATEDMDSSTAPPPPSRRRSKKDPADDMDPGLARIITAKCIPAAIDTEYDNPIDEPCSAECLTCATNPPPPPRSPCDCSGCKPEPSNPSQAKEVKPRKKLAPLRIRVTTKMKEVGEKRLQSFRQELWRRADERSTGMLPVKAFLPDSVITALLKNMDNVLSKDVLDAFNVDDASESSREASASLLKPFIGTNKQLAGASQDVIRVLLELHETFEEMRQQTKASNKAKRAQAKEGSSNVNVDEEEADETED